jgi:hypothetical protein
MIPVQNERQERKKNGIRRIPAGIGNLGQKIKIASDSPAYFIVANLLLPTNIAKIHSNTQFK